ncbi:MAG: hypothetical protein FK734_11935 [Asgard group archaeon]|nr:hypothetical protein [Asgard group archaeon]
MSEKPKSTAKKTTTKSSTSTAKKSTSSTAKKPATTKKPATSQPAATKPTTAKTTPKKTTTTKKPTTTAKPKAAPKTTTTTKKSTTSTTKTIDKKPATTKKPSKKQIIKAQITSYRRNNRLQKTNQAIAKVLDDYNHLALVGKKFTLEFPENETVVKGTVLGIHGQKKSKLLRLGFDNSGMTSYAITQIIEIEL